jgi:hypothetical protein
MFASGKAASASTGIPVRSNLAMFYARSTLTLASDYAPIAIAKDGSIYFGKPSKATGYTGLCSFINKVNQEFTQQWSTGIRTAVNTNMDNYATFIKVADSGNVYALGFDQYGGGSYNSLHLCKLNSSGAIQWSRMETDSTTTQNITTSGIAIDSSENIYISGTMNNRSGVVVLKYNSSGTLLASKKYTVSINMTGNELVLDEANSCLYIVGWMNDGNNPNAGAVIKIPTDLTTQSWAKSFYPDTASISYLSSGVVNSSGNIVCFGYFHQSALPEREQLYYVEINTSGTVVSSGFYQDASFSPSNYYPNYSNPRAAKDANGNIFISTVVNGANASNVGTASPFWGQKVVLMKIDSSFAISWQYLAGFCNYRSSNTAVDATGNAYFTLTPSNAVESHVITIPNSGLQTGESGTGIVFSPSPLTKQTANITSANIGGGNTGASFSQYTSYTSVTSPVAIVNGDLYNGTIKFISDTHILDIRNRVGNALLKLPTNLQQNDLVVVIANTSSNTADDVAVSGYTTVCALSTADTYDSYLYIGYKFMGATPDTTVTLAAMAASGNSGSMQVLCIRGVNTTTPLDVTTQTATLTNTAIIDAPSITPTTSGSLIISAIASATDSNAAYKDQDGSWSGTANLNSYGTYYSNQFVGIKKWVSGTFNPTTPTFDRTDAVTYSVSACTFALRPQ